MSVVVAAAAADNDRQESLALPHFHGENLYECYLFHCVTGGLLTFLSPCVLPLLPVYLAYMTGTQLKGGPASQTQRKRALFSALAFVFGFTLALCSFGMVLFSLVAECAQRRLVQ